MVYSAEGLNYKCAEIHTSYCLEPCTTYQDNEGEEFG